MTKSFVSSDVKAKFQTYPEVVKERLLQLRELIFDEAGKLEGTGGVQEALKWGQPSYLTVSKSGTTIRIDQYKFSDDCIALYVHCQTNLVEQFRDLYDDSFEFEKNRALLIDINSPLPETQLRHCVAMALTYHQRT